MNVKVDSKLCRDPGAGLGSSVRRQSEVGKPLGADEDGNLTDCER